MKPLTIAGIAAVFVLLGRLDENMTTTVIALAICAYHLGLAVGIEYGEDKG